MERLSCLKYGWHFLLTVVENISYYHYCWSDQKISMHVWNCSVLNERSCCFHFYGPTRWTTGPTRWTNGPTRWTNGPTRWTTGPTRWTRKKRAPHAGQVPHTLENGPHTLENGHHKLENGSHTLDRTQKLENSWMRGRANAAIDQLAYSPARCARVGPTDGPCGAVFPLRARDRARVLHAHASCRSRLSARSGCAARFGVRALYLSLLVLWS